MRRRVITELPARIINKWQVHGGDLCVVPVGSMEALGPHLPIGGRVFAAEAFAKLMAEAADGLCLPVVPLTSAFDSTGQPGTIDVSEAEVNRLLRAVLDDLYATGFRRIILVTYLDYARYYLATQFYEDHRCGAAGIHMTEALGGAMGKRGIREDSVILGALRVLGRDELLAKCGTKEKKSAPEIPKALAELRRMGTPAVRLPKGCYRLFPDESLDPEAGESALREAVEERLGPLESLREYNEYLSRRDSRGFLNGNWFRED